MPRFAANLSLMYGEHSFLDRFAAALTDGFDAVEFLFPYEHSPQLLANLLAAHGLRQVLFNVSPGDWAAGDRGLACVPGREAEFQNTIAQALDYAQALACPRVHVMAGVVPEGSDRTPLQTTYTRNLAWAVQRAADAGVDLLIEPINRRDMPGYFLNRQDHAHAVVMEVGAPNLKVQMDLYHCQIVEGDVATKLRQYLPTGRVGHMQIAGVPERHEPDQGELNYPYLFELIDSLGYAGNIGCEYRPRAGTSAGLTWLKVFRSG
ncbi:MAG: hydroxypyruvate isomerase family protein [Cytophagales bacterium]|nr:hydroxypyruvate isomerase family protein [Rhizobacter sp.]